MKLMTRKWHPGLSIQTPPPMQVPLIMVQSNGSNAAQVLALGLTLDSIGSLDPIRFRGPGRGLAEPEAKVLGPTLDAFDSVASDQGPESNESHASKVAPRTLDADAHP